jgi:3-oxoacyl-[acyl-carrier-protein] synthase II
VVISGFGLITPLGHSAWETFSSLLSGRTLADRAASLPEHVDPVDLVRALGSVSVAQHSATDPAVELAERAAREALFMAGASANDVGSVIGASKGAVHALLAAIENHRGPASRVSGLLTTTHRPTDAHLAVTLGPHGYLEHHLCSRLGIRPGLSIVAACASSLTAVHHARLALLDGMSGVREGLRGDRSGASGVRPPQRMLVVTAEAALLPLFIHSYRRLGVLPPLTAPGYRGLPLDRRRCGFMLTEAAAAVVLEWVDQPRPGQIELVDTAVACEAHDMVRAAPGMPALTRIARALLTDRPIDLLHPHATGTAEHDTAELAALAPLMATQPDVYACKGALGHGLGAAGLTALVNACLCATTGRRPPMPWLDEPIDAPSEKGSFRPTRDAPHRPLRCHGVFAGGFGGHVAGAVINRH